MRRLRYSPLFFHFFNTPNSARTYCHDIRQQRRGQELASQYRQITKNKLRKDIGWKQYSEASKEYLLIDSVLSGMIETFICYLQSRAIFPDCAYRIASKSVEKGIACAYKTGIGALYSAAKHEKTSPSTYNVIC